MAVLLLPRFGLSHTPGLSTADFEVEPGGPVDARLTFASAEPLGSLHLDRDHDGVVTPADVALASDDLKAFLLDGLEVTADQVPCPAHFRAASLDDDGLVLEQGYACPAGAREVAVTLFYLSGLPAGHREVARIVAGSATAEAVLSGDRRALALRLPAAPARALVAQSPRVLLLAAAVIALVAIALVARRRRPTS